MSFVSASLNVEEEEGMKDGGWEIWKKREVEGVVDEMVLGVERTWSVVGGSTVDGWVGLTIRVSGRFRVLVKWYFSVLLEG